MSAIGLEVDGTHSLGKMLFDASPIPIARGGDEQRASWGLLRLEGTVERRDANALQTFQMILEMAANSTAVAHFAVWLASKLKRDPQSVLRIQGKSVSKDEKAIREALAALEAEHRANR